MQLRGFVEGTLLQHTWSGSRGVDAVVTALVLAASRPSVSAPSNHRPCSSVMSGVRLWRMGGARRRHGSRLAFTSAQVSRAWFVAGCVPRAEVSSAVVAGVETAPGSWPQQSPGAPPLECRLPPPCVSPRAPVRGGARLRCPAKAGVSGAGGSGLLGWSPVRSSARLDERQRCEPRPQRFAVYRGRQDNHNPRRVNNHRPGQAPGDRVRGAAEGGDRRRSGHLRLNLDRYHAL
jgi:hypothetical protein